MGWLYQSINKVEKSEKIMFLNSENYGIPMGRFQSMKKYIGPNWGHISLEKLRDCKIEDLGNHVSDRISSSLSMPISAHRQQPIKYTDSTVIHGYTTGMDDFIHEL